jgi:hypothetical protein
MYLRAIIAVLGRFLFLFLGSLPTLAGLFAAFDALARCALHFK